MYSAADYAENGSICLVFSYHPDRKNPIRPGQAGRMAHPDRLTGPDGAIRTA
jgi:hypothetical protein